MTTNRAQLLALRERLLNLGREVPARAESFHRECAGLLAAVEGALSWRGVLGLGQRAERLAPLVDGLSARGLDLQALYGGIDQVSRQLDEAGRSLERITAPALRAPDGIPARLDRLRTELRRLGRQVKTADDLMVDRRLCAEARGESASLGEALGFWLTAEATLLKVGASPRTAALEATLPELGDRLCRDGPTPQWQSEFKALLGPLEQLARREQPREINEIEKIIKALPRWARILGTAGDDCAVLVERFKVSRRDWPDEDDRTFVELFEQARELELGLLRRAAALRRDGIAELESRCALVAELVGPDPGLDELVRDLRQEPADDPRDHEDWCELLREANEALQNRVKRSETTLLGQLGDHQAECRRRLDALSLIPRLDDKETQRARLSDAFDTLSHAGQASAPLALLDQVVRTRTLSTELASLEAAIRQDHAGLMEACAQMQRRGQWLMEQAQALAVALPEIPLDPMPQLDQAGRQSDPGHGLELVRLQLEDRQRLLSAAEARFARSCREAIAAAGQRLARVQGVLPASRRRDSGLDLPSEPAVTPADLDGLVDALGRIRVRLNAVAPLLDSEEESLKARALGLQQSLGSIQADGLGYSDRNDREAILRQFQQWQPQALADPVERISALGELIENAEHIQRRIDSAVRRLQERREALRERLRRFNALFLQGYCPDLYLRVEALTHPPEHINWPRGAEEAQLTEAERLFRLLERQAQRLAAREIGETLLALESHARRTQDPEVRTLIDEARALPSEQQPPARLRRRLADRLLGLRLGSP